MNSGLSSRARLATTPLWSHQHLASLMLNFIPTSSSFLLLSDALSRSDSSHNVIPVRRVHGESYTHPTPARGDPQQYTLLSRWNLYTAYSIIQLLFQASCHGFLSFSLSLSLSSVAKSATVASSVLHIRVVSRRRPLSHQQQPRLWRFISYPSLTPRVSTVKEIWILKGLRSSRWTQRAGRL